MSKKKAQVTLCYFEYSVLGLGHAACTVMTYDIFKDRFKAIDIVVIPSYQVTVLVWLLLCFNWF